jgi:hypothetical protein
LEDADKVYKQEAYASQEQELEDEKQVIRIINAKRDLTRTNAKKVG